MYTNSFVESLKKYAWRASIVIFSLNLTYRYIHINFKFGSVHNIFSVSKYHLPRCRSNHIGQHCAQTSQRWNFYCTGVTRVNLLPATALAEWSFRPLADLEIPFPSLSFEMRSLELKTLHNKGFMLLLTQGMRHSLQSQYWFYFYFGSYSWVHHFHAIWYLLAAAEHRSHPSNLLSSYSIVKGLILLTW